MNDVERRIKQHLASGAIEGGKFTEQDKQTLIDQANGKITEQEAFARMLRAHGWTKDIPTLARVFHWK